MLLVINKTTLAIQLVSSFSILPGTINNNGQHMQYPGHILAEVSLRVGDAGFRLLHDETTASSGHTDINVRYRLPGQPPTFHVYSYSQEFTPDFSAEDFNYAWPTGMWHLIQVTLAIETYLETNLGFEPSLRKFFFDALAANKLATA